jgi:hypothetical protein
MDPAELVENPLNWRRHPPEQMSALAGSIAEVGWAGACLLNSRSNKLIDGHARLRLALDQGTGKIPVLVGSWTEEQERLILATLDPIADMAIPDPDKLAVLLAGVRQERQDVPPSPSREALARLLADVAGEAGVLMSPDAVPGMGGSNEVEPKKEWRGMPEYEHEDQRAFKTLSVHFKDQAAVDKFARLVGQKITGDTRFLWFPDIEIGRYADKTYGSES